MQVPGKGISHAVAAHPSSLQQASCIQRCAQDSLICRAAGPSPAPAHKGPRTHALTLKGVLLRRYSYSGSVGSTLLGTANLRPLTASEMPGILRSTPSAGSAP